MEEDTGSPLIVEDRGIREVSDSNSSNCSSAESKLLEPDTSEAPSPRRKGVVPQQNGRWGCQIYANRQRIWLGTFKSKEDASMAYRSSALKLQAAETPRNEADSDEMKFQSLHSVETVLNMIKDGSYQSRFADYLKKRSQLPSVETELRIGLKRAESNKGITSKQMFQKELTPSDVGKLNRLVIPKKFAIQFFPPAPDEENVASKEVQLSFYDKSMKLWKFRYCYWRSSQSYVFTRGWSSFVKEKMLKANDTIAFYSCEGDGGVEGTPNFYMIDVNPRGDISSSSSGSSALTNPINAILEVPLQLTPGEEPLQLTPGDEPLQLTPGPTTVSNTEPKPEPAPVMLFGVNIRSPGM